MLFSAKQNYNFKEKHDLFFTNKMFYCVLYFSLCSQEGCVCQNSNSVYEKFHLELKLFMCLCVSVLCTHL